MSVLNMVTTLESEEVLP